SFARTWVAVSRNDGFLAVRDARGWGLGSRRSLQNLRSTSTRDFAMKDFTPGALNKTLTERNYELEKILYRIHRSVCFPLCVWIHLVRQFDAWCASGSARALATRSRV